MYPVVEMEYQRREEGYAALGGYFDGENDLDALFSYTQPVVMTYYPDVGVAGGAQTDCRHAGRRSHSRRV